MTIDKTVRISGTFSEMHVSVCEIKKVITEEYTGMRRDCIYMNMPYPWKKFSCASYLFLQLTNGSPGIAPPSLSLHIQSYCG